MGLILFSVVIASGGKIGKAFETYPLKYIILVALIILVIILTLLGTCCFLCFYNSNTHAKLNTVGVIEQDSSIKETKEEKPLADVSELDLEGVNV